ncbi:unnamed protein product [Closterium sp. NIES-53]
MHVIMLPLLPRQLIRFPLRGAMRFSNRSKRAGRITTMALRPSSVPLRVSLPPPPGSSLPVVPDPDSDLARAASPIVSRLLATVVTGPSFESTATSALLLSWRTLSVFASMLLAPEGDPDAPDIPTPRSYVEAIAGTYVDAAPLSGANIVDGMWIFRVKRPPGSPPAFKARYVARGFRQRQGVDYFQTFSPTPKMTTLRGSLHEKIWLRRPPGFTGPFPAGTQWTLRRPVYSLLQAPREWHDTLRTTLAAVGFTPSTADPSLFLRTDTLLPSFYVLVYVLQRFDFQFSSPHPTPLSTGHSLSAPPSDKAVEPSGPYPELVGCLMYLMTCTRPDLAYPLSLLARYVALGRHREVHWDAAKRVLRYLCSTSDMGLVLG